MGIQENNTTDMERARIIAALRGDGELFPSLAAWQVQIENFIAAHIDVRDVEQAGE